MKVVTYIETFMATDSIQSADPVPPGLTPRLGRGLLNVLIAGVLGLQVATFWTGTVVWPFIDYPMYSKPMDGPVSCSFYEITATLEDGQALTVDAASMSLQHFGHQLAAERMIAPPSDRPRWREAVERDRQRSLEMVVEAVRSTTGQTPVAVDVLEEIHELTDAGIETRHVTHAVGLEQSPIREVSP